MEPKTPSTNESHKISAWRGVLKATSGVVGRVDQIAKDVLLGLSPVEKVQIGSPIGPIPQGKIQRHRLPGAVPPPHGI